MNRLYQKKPVLFAVLWIVAYVVTVSAADNISETVGIAKSVTAVVCGLLAAVLLVWMKRNRLFGEYGLCRPVIPAGKLLYYIPLAVLASINIWSWFALNGTVLEAVLYIISMLLVGLLEELIFRGLLFKAMCKDGIKAAIIVSSVTFGIGHIVNLVNGSGADLFSNLLQVVYAIAAGFLFTILFYKTKSLWACIVTHGVLNALGVFVDHSLITPGREVASALVLTAVSLLYAVYIMKVQRKVPTR